MTCDEVQKLLDAYVDGELDLIHNIQVEEHLPSCASCQVAHQNYLTLRKTLQTSSFYYELPTGFEQKIQNSLRQALPNQPRPFSQNLPRNWVVLSGAVAALILLAVGSLLLTLSASRNNEQVAQEVVASHIRSLMVNHLEDVASTDQHTVKPWFNGKLNFSPSVTDFADKGYPLVGGRLDYLDNQSVAALVYQRAKHIINVFIWPAESGTSTKPQLQTIQGYHLFYWDNAGMHYWVVSDLNESELNDFVQLVQTG